MRYFLLALFLAGCTRCQPLPNPDPEPIPPPAAVDGGAPITVEGVCERLRSLGCEEGEPTPAGAPCEKWLASTLEAGLDLHLECLAVVTSCEQVGPASQGACP